MGLDFQKGVVGVDAVSPKCLEHELALPPEPIAVGGKANLPSITPTSRKRRKTPDKSNTLASANISDRALVLKWWRTIFSQPHLDAEMNEQTSVPMISPL